MEQELPMPMNVTFHCYHWKGRTPLYVKADGKMEGVSWVLFSHSDAGSHTSHKKVYRCSIGKAIQTFGRMGLSILLVGWFTNHRKRKTWAASLISWVHQIKWLWDSSLIPTMEKAMGNSNSMTRLKRKPISCRHHSQCDSRYHLAIVVDWLCLSPTGKPALVSLNSCP